MLFGKSRTAYLDQIDALKMQIEALNDERYLPPQHPTGYDACFNMWLPHFRTTYKTAYAESAARATELETFLEDLLTVDPKPNRFDAAEFSKKGKRKTPFKWNVAAVHDAAELIRADKAEAERRDALKELQGAGE